MSEFVCTGDMVEGARSSIYTRKEEWKGLQRDPITNLPMVKYELSKNCSVEVSEKLVLTPEEDGLRAKFPLHGEVGDKLKAKSITVYINQRKKLGDPEVVSSSGRHEGRLYYPENRTNGVIKYPFDNLRKITQACIAAGPKKLTD